MLWSNHRDGTYSCKNPRFNAQKENANDPRKKAKTKLTVKWFFQPIPLISALVRTDIIEGIWDTTVITVTDGLSKDQSLLKVIDYPRYIHISLITLKNHTV